MSYTALPDATLRQALSLSQGDQAAFQQLGAGLSPAERQAALAAGIQALPSCWGQRSQNCSQGRWDQLSWPSERCRAFGYGYIGDFAKYQAAINAIPYCDEQAPIRYAALAGVVGVLFGLGVGALIGSR